MRYLREWSLDGGSAYPNVCSSLPPRRSSSNQPLPPRPADRCEPPPVPIDDLELGLGALAVDHDGGVDGLAVDDHAHELQLDLAVGEELLAPCVEQHPVGRTGHLHALRHEAGQAELARLVGVGVEVAAAGVRP